jgi:hypothetical protein
MKKYYFLLTFLFTYLILTGITDLTPLVGAQNASDILGTIKPPPQIGTPGDGASAISTFISRIIQIIYMIGAIGFIFMLLWGALTMILNAGDKEALGNGRKRIITAIIGIALLALAFPILRVLESIIGIKFFF